MNTSDSRLHAIQKLIDTYIEKADSSKALLTATELRGEPLNEDELTRLAKRLMSPGRFNDAIDLVESIQAPQAICDILAQATWPDTLHAHDLPYERILSLNLSPHIKEVFIGRCKSRGIFIKKELYTFYRDLTNKERDELVLINLQGLKRDLVRAANIALAGVSPVALKKVLYACMESPDIDFDYTVRLAKAMRSRVATQYLIGHCVMRGEYEKALAAAISLRSSKKLTKDEFDECLANTLNIVLEEEYLPPFLPQLEDASLQKKKEICEIFLERGEPVWAGMIAETLDDIDLRDRCIKDQCKIISPATLRDVTFRLVQGGCSDIIRTCFFEHLAATHQAASLALVKEHADSTLIPIYIERSIVHLLNQEGNYEEAYEVAKLSTSDLLLKGNLLIILRHIFTFPTDTKDDIDWDEHLNGELADVAYRIFAENKDVLQMPHGKWLDALMYFALTEGNLQKALTFAAWESRPLAQIELDILCAKA